MVLVVAAPARADGPPVDASWRVVAGGDASTRQLALDVRVGDGWHVNAHDPDRPYLIQPSSRSSRLPV